MGSMIRSSLIGAGLPDFLGVGSHNTGWNTGKGTCPLKMWNDYLGLSTKIDYNTRVIFGSKLVNISRPFKKKLEPRASKDPRDYKDGDNEAPAAAPAKGVKEKERGRDARSSASPVSRTRRTKRRKSRSYSVGSNGNTDRSRSRRRSTCHVAVSVGFQGGVAAFASNPTGRGHSRIQRGAEDCS